MNSEDEKFKEKLEKIYEEITFSKFVIEIPIVIVLVSIAFDICPCEYKFHIFQTIFQRESVDYTAVASLVLVVWAFTASLIIFYLGRFEAKHYGIRTVDVLINKIKYKKITKMLLVFVMELAAVFGAVLYQWEITLTISVILQMAAMIYVFLMVCVETSKTNVERQIKKATIGTLEDEKKISPMMVKMLEGIEYKRDEEAEKLKNMLVEIASELVLDSDSQYFCFMKKCTDYIIRNCEDAERSAWIIKNLLTDIEKIPVKKGIFCSVLENVGNKKAPEVMQVVNIDFEGRREVILWGIAYNAYRELAEGQSFRKIISKELENSLEGFPDEEDKRLIYTCWIKLVEENEAEYMLSEENLQELHLNELWNVVDCC